MILLILRKLLCYLKLAERAQETEINGALREVAAAELIERRRDGGKIQKLR